MARQKFRANQEGRKRFKILQGRWEGLDQRGEGSLWLGPRVLQIGAASRRVCYTSLQ